jgi:hypothetical protein
MGNIVRDAGAVHFLVNGGDRGTAIKGLMTVLAVAVVVFLGFLAGLAADSMALSLASLAAGIPILFIVLRMITSGRFARYRVSFLREGTVRCLDLRTGSVLWEEPTEPSRLYMARTRVQVGYVTGLRDALVYGCPAREIVEDSPPSTRMTLLCIGKEDALQELRQELAAFSARG